VRGLTCVEQVVGASSSLPPREKEPVHLETGRPAGSRWRTFDHAFVFPSSPARHVRIAVVFGWDMDDLDGSWSVSLRAAAAVNASWTEGAGVGVSRQTRLVLEILMVLMCVCAVAGRGWNRHFFFI